MLISLLTQNDAPSMFEAVAQLEPSGVTPTGMAID